MVSGIGEDSTTLYRSPTVTVTFSQESFLLVTRFWPNFKGRLLGTSLTDANCHGDICPGDICQYQECFSCYWLDFDQTLNDGSWEHLAQFPTVTVTFVQATFVLEIFVYIRNITVVAVSILTKLMLTFRVTFVQATHVLTTFIHICNLTQILFGPKIFSWSKNFFEPRILQKKISDPTFFFGSKIFSGQNFF